MHSPALILGEYLAIRATHEMGPVLNEIDSRPFLPGLNAHTASEGAVEQDEIHAARRGHVTAKELRDHFHLPLHTVAKKFGMCTTAFKKLCRRFGLAKWPHRQLRGIDKKIAALKTELNYSATGQNDQYLAGLSNLEMEKARLAQGAMGANEFERSSSDSPSNKDEDEDATPPPSQGGADVDSDSDDASTADLDEAPHAPVPVRDSGEMIGAGITVTQKELRNHFHLPLHTVAKKFGMCTTAFKKLCRRFGIAKWPHRQLRGIDKKIAALKAELNYSTVDKESACRNLLKLEDEKAKLSQGAEWTGLGLHLEGESRCDTQNVENGAELESSSRRVGILNLLCDVEDDDDDVDTRDLSDDGDDGLAAGVLGQQQL